VEDRHRETLHGRRVSAKAGDYAGLALDNRPSLFLFSILRE
jgi:hypothetical protein